VTDDGSDSHIVFVVRDDASHSALFFQTSDTTWQAYNTYGGNSLYVGGPGSNPDRAYKVSYNRPFSTRGTSREDCVFNAEYPMIGSSATATTSATPPASTPTATARGSSGTGCSCRSGTDTPQRRQDRPLWRGTAVAGQAPGATTQLGDQIVGYEWDEDFDNGFRPAGLIDLSTTTATGVQVLQDYGHAYASGTATHHLTLCRDTNGAGPDALVFGAGTVQWPWGLDADYDRGSAPAEPAMQQATVNLFADMGVQPGSLQTGSPAATSTDTVAPTSTITSQAPGATVTAGVSVTVRGTAADTGGGRVGGVEMSVDGGASWHPADGRESWRYTFTPTSTGQPAILSRAADDSGNLGPPPPETPGGGGATPRGTGHPTARGSKVKVTPRRIRVSRKGRVVLRVTCPAAPGAAASPCG
jgi:Bacterial Ig domain